MRDIRRPSTCTMRSESRKSSGVRAWRDSATSASPQITAVGVRSSCEASAMKRRCCSKEVSKRASRSLITIANRPSSSRSFATGNRSFKLVAPMRAACALISATGARARCAITSALNPAKSDATGTATPKAMASRPSTLWRLCKEWSATIL